MEKAPLILSFESSNELNAIRVRSYVESFFSYWQPHDFEVFLSELQMLVQKPEFQDLSPHRKVRD